MASYRKALALKPNYAEAHNNLGQCAEGPRQARGGRRQLHGNALALKPDYAEAHNNLGNALRELGKLEEGVASYHKALAIKPDYAEAHNNLGNALRDLGRLNEAVASYHKALAIKPDYAEVHYNLGSAFQELGRLDEAVTSYHKASPSSPISMSPRRGFCINFGTFARGLMLMSLSPKSGNTPNSRSAKEATSRSCR